jgi:methionyl-tRNA formyltransferase
MKVVIIGQKWLAAELLRFCVGNSLNVLTVICPNTNDRLIDMANQLRVPSKIIKGRITHCHVPVCDLILSAYCHQFIDQSARKQASYGAVGYHPSLLPNHRGIDAVKWVIYNKELVTGGTLFRLDDGMDTGDIIFQDWCHTRPDDTAQALWRRELAPMGLGLFKKFLLNFSSELIRGQKQDNVLATFEPVFDG